MIDTDSFEMLARAHVGGRAEGLLVDPRGCAVFVSAQADNNVVKLTLPQLRKLLGIPTDARPDAILLVPGRLRFERPSPE